MQTVFVLQYERPSAGEVKLLGVYSSQVAINEAIIRFREDPELRGYLECFTTLIYEVDKDGWTPETERKGT
jgi:hypothetical protein